MFVMEVVRTGRQLLHGMKLQPWSLIVVDEAQDYNDCMQQVSLQHPTPLMQLAGRPALPLRLTDSAWTASFADILQHVLCLCVLWVQRMVQDLLASTAKPPAVCSCSWKRPQCASLSCIACCIGVCLTIAQRPSLARLPAPAETGVFILTLPLALAADHVAALHQDFCRRQLPAHLQLQQLQ